MSRHIWGGWYVAHSVVRYRRQTFDLTRNDNHLPFVRHIGTDDEFRDMEVRLSEIFWPPRTDINPSDLTFPDLEEYEPYSN